MSVNRKKLIIGAVIVALAGALVAANVFLKREKGVEVDLEKLAARDLEAVVSASGKIQARTTVNISSQSMGRVTRLAVKEGDRVQRGQFLVEIDPRSLRSQVERGDAALSAQRVAVAQARTQLESAKTQLALARETLKRQQGLWDEQLTTREALDRAENEVQVREREVEAREAAITMEATRVRQTAADLANARYNLGLLSIESPIDGIVTRRSIEIGENVMIGTMNNPGTVLMTIADMSIIEAELEVDETDIPTVALGQPAKVTIDALPDREFTGTVTEIGNSPIQAAAAAAARATNFKVVVTIDGEIPEVRPGFTCTADITTATRKSVVSVPIQATTVRELVYDEKGAVVKPPETGRKTRRAAAAAAPPDELKPGQTRKETEGVFAVKDGKAVFKPVKTGIAGEKYLEALSGVAAGEEVIVGPFNSVRDLKDGDPVKVKKPAAKK
ncbi:MAG TPA: efflux RND transporter periplasmic adaptor subunit [Vicinamibacterales bacterium]|nr:efflux RND transporter periplasmic adaptor subunit [Vicinamibacterales bacterium]